ncbi:MAG: hypothetical protein R6U19_01300 [Bacteroidales bacterium]
MVFIKPISCSGCIKVLFDFLEDKNLIHCRKAIVHYGGGDIVRKKSLYNESEELLPGSECLFYYKKNCNTDNSFYALFNQCNHSPCVGIFKDEQLFIFDSDDMFKEMQGYLSIRKAFAERFSQLTDGS